MTTLIISNEKIEDIMKIVKSLQESGLLIKDISKTIKNNAKNEKANFSACYFDAQKAKRVNLKNAGFRKSQKTDFR